MSDPFLDILEVQPRQRQRVLVRFIDSKVRIGDYDRFDWRWWGAKQWKAIPDERQQQSIP